MPDSSFGIPFVGKSNYKHEFINYGPAGSGFDIKRHDATVLKDMPFFGGTTYNDDYKKNAYRTPVKALKP